MSKNIGLIMCLLSGFCSIAMAAAPPLTELEKQQEEVKAYFRKTPEELHQDVLKQQVKDQEWLEEQAKQAKRKKIAAGQEVKSGVAADKSVQALPSVPAGTATVPAESPAPAPKSPQDYSRGY